MGEYAKKSKNVSRVLNVNREKSEYPSMDVILQQYKQYNQRYSSNENEFSISGEKLSVPLQLKAGVKSFDVTWSEYSKNDGKNAAFYIEYEAEFKHGGGYDANDAEFRQNASDDWSIMKDGKLVDSGKTPLEDDNYNKVVDSEMYTGDNHEFFKGKDIPGWSENELEEDEDVTWSFTAEQMIIDTSLGDTVIARKAPRTVTIKGKHPRLFGL